MKANLRELRAPKCFMMCEIGGCGANVEASVPDIAAHLTQRHGLRPNGTEMEGVALKGCPWPGCSGRKVATASIPAHVLWCHGPSGLYECMVCYRYLETRRDTAKGHVRNCVKLCVVDVFFLRYRSGSLNSHTQEECGTDGFSGGQHTGEW